VSKALIIFLVEFQTSLSLIKEVMNSDT